MFQAESASEAPPPRPGRRWSRSVALGLVVAALAGARQRSGLAARLGALAAPSLGGQSPLATVQSARSRAGGAGQANCAADQARAYAGRDQHRGGLATRNNPDRNRGDWDTHAYQCPAHGTPHRASGPTSADHGTGPDGAATPASSRNRRGHPAKRDAHRHQGATSRDRAGPDALAGAAGRDPHLATDPDPSGTATRSRRDRQGVGYSGAPATAWNFLNRPTDLIESFETHSTSQAA